ncbi:UDP-glucose 4-epimerase [Silvibacterium bohemicum]|uniref:UDP-glucose 4-epimerase n=1 Tax=Silvibacterium bohemicum TaxID=1577686 RepID=A0A841JYV5_9BACT|nr:NAD-dependent epimerase/dehydratase family protein [Silvibacterium bohemicum]MBB6144899.1 UDP-glucose 4-epimerase [Silvibacterium bohemicum]
MIADTDTSEKAEQQLPYATGRNRFFIVGGAGFIGSHLADRLMKDERALHVTLFDNFSSGREWHIQKHLAHGEKRFRLTQGDVLDLDRLIQAMSEHDVVVHLASNPDISRAVEEPEIDFHQGTVLTNNVLEAMRRAGVPHLLYASGSGVYGEAGDSAIQEEFGPLKPISTYGASKLAGEALIASYCSMFGISASVFRFGNVVGARQTHGVGFDFLRKLRSDPARLRILGDGRQSKSYIHISDVIEAILLVCERSRENYEVFNVATNETVTVTEIAELAVEALGLREHPQFVYTGGSRGWKGDVPNVRLDTTRIRALGWKPAFNCLEAIQRSLEEMVADERVLVS